MSRTWNIDVPGVTPFNAPPKLNKVKLKMSQAIVDNMEKIQARINEINQEDTPKIPITICYDGQSMFCRNMINPLFFFDGGNHIKIEKSDILFQSNYLTDGYNIFYIEQPEEDVLQFVAIDLIEGATTAGDITLRDMDVAIHRFLCAKYMPFDAAVVDHES